jgi:serine/threonine-protein kinase RsbW
MGSSEKRTIRLEMTSQLAVLEKAREIVGRLASAAGFGAECRKDIEVAVHECLANAILHGSGGDQSRRVTVDLELDGRGLEIRVCDEGPGFDPARIPDPVAPENLRRSSGRGILMMRVLMDSVTFCRSRGGGMEVTMRKRYARGAQASAAIPA